eukprot:5096884-Prymnesium_polylepis.1
MGMSEKEGRRFMAVSGGTVAQTLLLHCIPRALHGPRRGGRPQWPAAATAPRPRGAPKPCSAVPR